MKIVFDIDDQCDEWNCLDDVLFLRSVYPGFKVTLFTIPNRISRRLLDETASHDWIEVAVHGVNHEPLDEMLSYSRGTLRNFLSGLDYSRYARGFRPPGWYLTRDVIDACNDAGLWVAMHVRDVAKFGPLCDHGYYACGANSWHGHTHDVCNNWVREHRKMLSILWPRDQEFAFVSESVIRP